MQPAAHPSQILQGVRRVDASPPPRPPPLYSVFAKLGGHRSALLDQAVHRAASGDCRPRHQHPDGAREQHPAQHHIGDQLGRETRRVQLDASGQSGILFVDGDQRGGARFGLVERRVESHSRGEADRSSRDHIEDDQEALRIHRGFAERDDRSVLGRGGSVVSHGHESRRAGVVAVLSQDLGDPGRGPEERAGAGDSSVCHFGGAHYPEGLPPERHQHFRRGALSVQSADTDGAVSVAHLRLFPGVNMFFFAGR
jgi:hypothetical protein